MPQCLIRGVRSVELVATNFEEAARFYEDVWGLRPVPSRDGTRLLSRHRRLITTSSVCIAGRGRRSSASCSTWRTAQGVDALHRAVAAAGCPVGAPRRACRRRRRLRLRLQGSGRPQPRLRVRRRRPRATRRISPIGRARSRTSISTPATSTPACGSSPRRSAFARSTRMRRCGSCTAPVPITRSIVLAKTNLPTLNHVAFEMPDFDSVMRGMGRMKDNGYPIEWGPGRHGPGNNVFAYFCGPDELPIEYTVGCAADRRQLRAARLGLLEISVRTVGPLGHHAAALGPLLPRPAAVRLHRGRLPPLGSGRAKRVHHDALTGRQSPRSSRRIWPE